MDTEGKHTNPEQMKVTLPAGYTPDYWETGQALVVPEHQPWRDGHDNEWLVIGVRPLLVLFANQVAHLHFTCASPVH